MTTPPFDPQPCGPGSGTGEPGVDVESSLLCDVGPDGQVLGTALVEAVYDETGVRTGTRLVDPATGAVYVPQGTMQPCPGEVGCAPPVQFCFTTTTTGPVEHPGRIYDLTLPINPGFAVDSLQIDATNYPANITWAVTDADGEIFRAALQSFLAARFPSPLIVTVTNPNAGTPVCGLATPMTIHIECARIDTGAPDLVELIYNGGRDLVVNPAYLTTPPTNLNGPQFVYLRRQDAGGTLNCTSVANQGWETNDLGDGNRDFELWGQGPGGLQTLENATPTPRGTPIQEITADINDTGTGPTIWQTFTVPAGGTFRAVLVHGARDNGEQHRITLSTGDTNDNQVGDIINNVTNPPQVTNAGGNTPGPWTSFSQDVALGAGVYTFAISTTNPVGANRGGLFTDMRVFQDSPDQHAAAVTDDETCTVTTEETVTTTTCEYWQPRCSNGEITDWVNVADGQELTNAAFWGQAPAPRCCLPEAGEGGGGSVTPGNLVHNYEVCAEIGGVDTTLQRIVITDQSGGVIGQTFVGPNGGPVTPASYTVGACSTGGNCPTVLGEVCVTSPDFPGVTLPATAVRNCDGTMSYLNAQTGNPWPNASGPVVCPPDNQTWEEILCDQGNGNQPFRRIYNLTPLGSVVFYDEALDASDYTVIGPAVTCVAGGLVLGEVCYSPPVQGPSFRGSLGGGVVSGGGTTVTLANFQGSGVTVTVTSSSPNLADAGAGGILIGGAGPQTITFAFSSSVLLDAVAPGDLDQAGTGENFHTFSTPYTGLTGNLFESPAGTVRSLALNANPDGDIQFGGTSVSTLSFTRESGGGGEFLNALGFSLPATSGQVARAAVVRCDGCEDGDLTYVDLATGTTLDLNTVALVDCPTTDPIATTGLCLADGTPIAVVTRRDSLTGALSQDGWVNLTTSAFTAGNPPVGTVACGESRSIQISGTFCDVDGGGNVLALVLIEYTYNPDGTIASVRIVNATTGATYTPVGTITTCPEGTSQPEQDLEILCDVVGGVSTPFIRDYRRDESGAITAVSNYTLGGAAFTPTGTVGLCAPTAGRDEELLILCDSTPTRFLRRYNYDSATGALISVTNTTLDGSTPFAPVGAVAVCTTAIASDFDFLSTVLCDANGTQFIQRLTFNSATGAVTATTNTTLTGGAFTPVGAVALCSNCCPVVVGEGCSNTGSGFYTAIRATNGTITLIDSVSGATITAANIIPCPGDDTVRTLTAQARTLTNATPWTPGGDVVGTLTSLTVTGTSGLWDLVDANGTALTGLPAGLTLTWSAEDDNQLTGPQSVTPQAGSTVIASWTQR